MNFCRKALAIVLTIALLVFVQSSFTFAQGGTVSSTDPCTYALKSSTPINITTTGTLGLVGPVSGASIYACGFITSIPNTATTPTAIQFEYGTNTNCVTPTTLTGAMGSNDAAAVSANPTVLSSGGGAQTLFKAPSGTGLCSLTTGGSPIDIQGFLTFIQQ